MSADVDALIAKMKSASSPLRDVLSEMHSRYHADDSGEVATYIPELARTDPRWFGICIATVDGQVFEVGDSRQHFTLQSVSKPFMYGLALEDHGPNYVLSKVGVEPSGDAFNAIVLDEKSNRPFNPMVNAGAIATADMVKGMNNIERTRRMMEMFGRYFGRPASIDTSVFMSERSTGNRNRAMAYLMLNAGMIAGPVDETLELYFNQCSVLVSARDLAVMGATMANRGLNPITKERAIDERYIKYLLSIMYTCGMYDYAGEWAYRVGMPAKSGVGGGIVAVVPGKLGVGIFSPKLDEKGNSVRGVRFCTEFSERFGLHVFDPNSGDDALGKLMRGGRAASAPRPAIKAS